MRHSCGGGELDEVRPGHRGVPRVNRGEVGGNAFHQSGVSVVSQLCGEPDGPVGATARRPGADAAVANVSNKLVIGATTPPLIYGDFSTNQVAVNGTLSSKGTINAITAKTSAYTALVSDEIITGDATSAAFTITLPTAVGKTGQTYTIKRVNSGANAVTVGTTSSQTIDGAATYALSAQYKYVKVVSDGSHWIIVGNN